MRLWSKAVTRTCKRPPALMVHLEVSNPNESMSPDIPSGLVTCCPRVQCQAVFSSPPADDCWGKVLARTRHQRHGFDGLGCRCACAFLGRLRRLHSVSE